MALLAVSSSTDTDCGIPNSLSVSQHGDAVCGTTSVNDGKLHHGAVIVNGSNYSLYVDGSLQKTGTMTTNTTGNTFYIGANSGNNFTGLIDQVRIYNYARTPAQIAWDYNRGLPIAWYKLDECQGTTVYSQNTDFNSALNGTINIGNLGTQSSTGTCSDGLSTSAWYNGRNGKTNTSLNFDGTDDYISVGTATSASSVSLWVKPTSNTANLIQLSTSSAYISATSGVLSATGFTSPIIYVNGTPSTILTAGTWNLITVTSSTPLLVNALKIGLIGSTYYSGQIDEVKLYNYALTPLQVKDLFNNGAINFGGTGIP